MAQALDATERRARRKRLVIIPVVVAVLFVGALIWGRTNDRAVNSKAASATTELRRACRTVDLDDLQREYSSAVTAANDTGDYSRASAMFPESSDATFFRGGFVRAGVFTASYNLTAGLGGRRCIQMRVTGPTPNRVAFQQRDGECSRLSARAVPLDLEFA